MALIIIKNTIEIVRPEECITLLSIGKENLPPIIASIVAPKAPTAPASLGVAQPRSIEPLINAINVTGGKNALRTIIGNFPFSYSISSSLIAGATFGSTEAHMKMNIKYINARVNPGISAPINKLPTETCIISAIIINIILGGIRIPKVPEAAITPVAKA